VGPQPSAGSPNHKGSPRSNIEILTTNSPSSSAFGNGCALHWSCLDESGACELRSNHVVQIGGNRPSKQPRACARSIALPYRFSLSQHRLSTVREARLERRRSLLRHPSSRRVWEPEHSVDCGRQSIDCEFSIDFRIDGAKKLDGDVVRQPPHALQGTSRLPVRFQPLTCSIQREQGAPTKLAL
jgi:hypothetical protein